MLPFARWIDRNKREKKYEVHAHADGRVGGILLSWSANGRIVLGLLGRRAGEGGCANDGPLASDPGLYSTVYSHKKGKWLLFLEAVVRSFI